MNVSHLSQYGDAVAPNVQSINLDHFLLESAEN